MRLPFDYTKAHFRRVWATASAALFVVSAFGLFGLFPPDGAVQWLVVYPFMAIFFGVVAAVAVGAAVLGLNWLAEAWQSDRKLAFVIRSAGWIAVIAGVLTLWEPWEELVDQWVFAGSSLGDVGWIGSATLVAVSLVMVFALPVGGLFLLAWIRVRIDSGSESPAPKPMPADEPPGAAGTERDPSCMEASPPPPRRVPRLAEIGVVALRLDDGRYRPATMLMDKQTRRVFFVRQPQKLGLADLGGGYALDDLDELVTSGRVTTNRSVVKGLMTTGHLGRYRYLTAMPTRSALERLATSP